MEGTGWQAVIFWLLFGMTVLPAAAVLVVRDIVRIAFLLLFVFGGLAGFYVLLGADFLAVIQVLIYIGGILILLLFGVMLTSREPILIKRTPERALVGPGIAAAAVIFIGLTVVIFRTDWYRAYIPIPRSTPSLAVADLPIAEVGAQAETVWRPDLTRSGWRAVTASPFVIREPAEPRSQLLAGDEVEVVAGRREMEVLAERLREVGPSLGVPADALADFRVITPEPAVLTFRVIAAGATVPEGCYGLPAEEGLTPAVIEARCRFQVVPFARSVVGADTTSVRVAEVRRPTGSDPAAYAADVPPHEALLLPGYRVLKEPFLAADTRIEAGDLVTLSGPGYLVDRVRRLLDLPTSAMALAPTQTARRIGDLLMTDYILPFEASSIVLLAALIGAAFIARRKGA